MLKNMMQASMYDTCL